MVSFWRGYNLDNVALFAGRSRSVGRSGGLFFGETISL